MHKNYLVIWQCKMEEEKELKSITSLTKKTSCGTTRQRARLIDYQQNKGISIFSSYG